MRHSLDPFENCLGEDDFIVARVIVVGVRLAHCYSTSNLHQQQQQQQHHSTV